MCEKQPMVNWRFLNKKKKNRKKKKDLIDRYKNDSQSPKISMYGKHKGGNVEFLFARQSSSPILCLLFYFLFIFYRNTCQFNFARFRALFMRFINFFFYHHSNSIMHIFKYYFIYF